MVQENSINKQKLVIICGPTASSKTALAIKCAQLLNSEIISADSMNVYRTLDIGTAKPSKEEQAQVKHHLIDVVEPTETFSVGDYRELALGVINDLHSKGKVPVICGGTGFYINSLIYNLSYGNSCADLETRDFYKKLAQENGYEYVYNILKEKDPVSAGKIHFNDLKRVIRALEIYHSGIKKSEIKDELTPIFDFKAYTIDFPREILYQRINQRVDIMVENGLIGELSSIIKSGVTFKNQSMQGIGYKEFADYFSGNIPLEQVVENIKLNTRHYAKRQITFFKKMPNLINLDYQKDLDTLAKEIVANIW